MEPVLALDRLTAYNLTDPTFLVFGRKAVPAVVDVSLQVAAGQTLVLLGESGSGKSTLLRTVAGQQPAESGRILLAGREVSQPAREPRIQLVPQDPRQALMLDQPFAAAVCAELAQAGRGGGEAARERLAGLLQEMDLGPEFLDRTPAACSGGQVQRLALARALAFEPAVLLLDEPVSGVDPHTADLIMRTIRIHQSRLRMAILLATHDLVLARRLGHQAAVLLAGRLMQTGPVAQVLDEPRR